MYALAICGSPRKNGNTTLILNTVLGTLREKGWETELETVGGKDIKGCTACGACFKRGDGTCIINDAFNPVFAKMLKADAIIIGSPTYFADVTAETKALIDRSGFVAMANGNALKGKIGAGVSAVRRGGATHTVDTINHLFMISRMIIPGSTYWNMVYGLHKGDAANDKEGLANMTHIAEVIDWLGRAVKPHMDSFPDAVTEKEG
ncbi:flavodoxin family protein [Geovibrio ferrireducens]|uniref:flavodoxin family protein n=1 Tax=Geovibrio ferrireducens TaxID=46201 RepID=UPI0022455097|nr:flavodoxin family protein [Geovibrio ferrireducens]